MLRRIENMMPVSVTCSIMKCFAAQLFMILDFSKELKTFCLGPSWEHENCSAFNPNICFRNFFDSPSMKWSLPFKAQKSIHQNIDDKHRRTKKLLFSCDIQVCVVGGLIETVHLLRGAFSLFIFERFFWKMNRFVIGRKRKWLLLLILRLNNCNCSKTSYPKEGMWSVDYLYFKSTTSFARYKKGFLRQVETF